MNRRSVIHRSGVAAMLCLVFGTPSPADVEPCATVSPAPPTLTMTLLNGTLCISDPSAIGTALQIQVDVSGLDPSGADEHKIRGAQFFLNYTDETCTGGSSAFNFASIEPGEPGSAGSPDDSPFQEEIATDQVDPVVGGTPGLLAYAVGIPPGQPQSACNNALATFVFTPTSEGSLVIWFRDPLTLPATMLSDDAGGSIAPPELQLPQGNEANALTITVDFTAPAMTCPADATVQAGASTDPSATGQATASDNCDANPVVTYEDAVTAGDCASHFTISRTWTATDTCGNTGACVQRIQVGDAEDCACPDDDGDGVCNDTDNCPDTANPDQADEDDDGVGDACQSVPDEPTPDPVPDPVVPPDPWSLLCSFCGGGLCGFGTLGALPFMLLGLSLMKRRMRHANR